MTAKQYLASYHRIACNYKASVKDYKAVEADMISIKSPSLEDRVQTSPTNDPIGEIVINMEKRKATIGVRMLNFQTKMTIIRNQLAELENVNEEYYTILMLRYVLAEDWKSICSNLAKSRTQANRIHGLALAEFDKRFGDSYR
jgi:hypothetical protein